MILIILKSLKEKAKKEKKAQDLKALEDLAEESVPKSFDLLKQASETLTNAKSQIFRNFENYLKQSDDEDLDAIIVDKALGKGPKLEKQ